MAGERLPLLADRFLPLGVTQGGSSSAVSQSLFINVKDAPYSAAGDGVNKDSNAINLAISAASAAGGGVVFFPRGTYLLDTTLVLDGLNGILLQGVHHENAGASAASRIIWAGSTGTAISAKSTSGCGIEHLFVQATHAAYTDTLIDATFIVSDTSFFTIEHCNVAAAATATTCTLVDLDHVQLTSLSRNNFSGGGIHVKGRASGASYSNNVRITENQFISQNITALQNPGQSWTIIGNNFETPNAVSTSVGSAIHCTTTTNSTIVFSNWFGDGVTGMNWIRWSGNNLVLIGNYMGGVASGGSMAVNINGPANQNITIHGNEFVAWVTGVNFTNANNGIEIRANTFTSVGTNVVGHTLSTAYLIEQNIPGTSDGSHRAEVNQIPNVELSQAAGTATAGMVKLGSTTASTVGAAGGASALPATPLGYLIINVAGTQCKLPYYNT